MFKRDPHWHSHGAYVSSHLMTVTARQHAHTHTPAPAPHNPHWPFFPGRLTQKRPIVLCLLLPPSVLPSAPFLVQKYTETVVVVAPTSNYNDRPIKTVIRLLGAFNFERSRHLWRVRGEPK